MEKWEGEVQRIAKLRWLERRRGEASGRVMAPGWCVARHLLTLVASRFTDSTFGSRLRESAADVDWSQTREASPGSRAAGSCRG